MSSTRENKITTITNDEAYDLAGHMARLADSANVVIKVSSQAERDALVKEAGKAVIRTDLAGQPIERCDGTNWHITQHAEFTFANGGVPSETVWGCGTLTNDATKTTDSSFVTIATDSISLAQPGIYNISVAGNFAHGPTGRTFMQLMTSGGTNIVRNTTGASEDTGNVQIGNYRITAATTITITCYIKLASGTTTWTGRVRVTKVGH